MATVQAPASDLLAAILSENEKKMMIDSVAPTEKKLGQEEVSDRAPSPALSDAGSTHTFSSTGDGYLLRELYGRTFNSVSDVRISRYYRNIDKEFDRRSPLFD